VYREPAADLTIPVPKEERVVEPLWLTVNMEVPVEEAIWNRSVPALPWINKVVVGVMVPMPTKSVEVAL
jgi:hypothetical protein